MATKHLVPSKDALRLLRQLASAPYHPLQYDDAVSSKKPQSRQCAAKERYAARPSRPIGICRHQYSLTRIIQPRGYHNNQLYNRHRHVRLYVTAAEALLNVQEEESEADHSFAPTHQDFENPQLGQILIDDHEILLERILAVRHTDGDFAAKSLLEEMLISYMSTNEPKHAQIAETLFLTVRQHSTGIDLGSVQYVALTALLEKYRSATRAASLLFWDLSTTHVRHYRHHIRRTASYLKQLCKHNRESPIFLLDHTLKLLQSVQLCGFPISADITFPVIQSAVAAGLNARAHKFFSAVQHDYGFHDVFPSILELTRGYARTHDWSAVDNLLEDLHRQGYPRSKPFAFASLVEGTLTLFIPHHGDSRFYDYLIYCIQEHGLVPTPELARLIYVSCVRAQRPDLAQKWTKDLLTAWPTMLSTARIPQTAHDIAVAWAATTASCVDILNTCIAFAYGSVRSPFSDDFKNLAKEALMHDLARRGQRYQDTYDIQVTDQDSWNPDKFHTPQAFFEHVEALLHRDLGQRGKLVRTLSKTELIKHFVAARQTVLLLDDFDTYVATYGPRFEVEFQINENLSSATRRKRQMKQNQARKWSSIDTFPAFHAAIKRECKEIDGSSATRAIILKQVLEVLQSEWRYSDIAGLLLKYSRLRSAAETFDEEIFTYWLVAARGIQGEVWAPTRDDSQGVERLSPNVQNWNIYKDVSTVANGTRRVVPQQNK
ncbi:hypothetical protein LTR05_000200 [Lithohypha guttulata]|uniref:Uncharacterized protein n=1 Tax=Lithohypha guttulata TaxID=1690604 RepID=A0AAN7YK46_9EURO|nr:hypothetical protein LTR05_000200 [Lithohypha guttulata]